MYDVHGIGTPVFVHDCSQCVFLGNYEKRDLYFCPQLIDLPTVIARYGPDGPDYTSGLEAARQVSQSCDIPDLRALRIAYLIARDQGLVK